MILKLFYLHYIPFLLLNILLNYITFKNLIIFFFTLPTISLIFEIVLSNKKTILVIKKIVFEYQYEDFFIATLKYLFLFFVAVPHRFWIKIPKPLTKLSLLRDYLCVIVLLLLSCCTPIIIFFLLFINIYLLFVYKLLTSIILEKSKFRIEGKHYLLPNTEPLFRIYTKKFFG